LPDPRHPDGKIYDVPGCELGHHGEDVSFDSILKKYHLNEPALLLLADIVRAADSNFLSSSGRRRSAMDRTRLPFMGLSGEHQQMHHPQS
jgi:hypothetical protein